MAAIEIGLQQSGGDRETPTRGAVGDREQDGVGVATVITIGRVLFRTYLAGFAQDGW